MTRSGVTSLSELALISDVVIKEKIVVTKLCFYSLTGIALAVAGAIFPTSGAVSQPRVPPLVTAHRGGAALMPENTLPAFDNALRLGVDMLEFDMAVTADDKLVVQHDATVDPAICSADPAAGVAPGPIRFLTLAQVLKFDCGSKPRDIYLTARSVPGTPMPTPGELFARYKNTKVFFFGEAKMPHLNEGEVDPVAFVKLIELEVRKYGLQDRFILQSSDYRTIDAMHVANPRIRTCLLKPWQAEIDHLKLVRQHHASCILLRLQDADAREVRRLRRAGIMVFSEVIDDGPSWRAYLARGDDALFTNDPAALIKFLDRNAKRR
jgi:glycerophosphoryl diester phosphodiesterase